MKAAVLAFVVCLGLFVLGGETTTNNINFNFEGLVPPAPEHPSCPEQRVCPEDPFVVFSRSLSINASVLVPTSSGYDVVYTKFFSSSLQGVEFPLIIVKAAEVADVVKTVNYARNHGLEFGVKGGTHAFDGLAMPRRGLLLDLSLMNTVQVLSNTVRFGAGALCGDLDAATRSQNRAVVCGSCYSVGAGFFGHGGFGALSRLHGLAIDTIVSVDLVTANGQMVTASATQNSELFWGIRGALPNFGVAVSFVLQSFDVSTYYGGIARFQGASFPLVAAWLRERATNPNVHARLLLGINAAGNRILTIEIAVWGSDLTSSAKATYLSSLLGIAGLIDSNLGVRTYFDQQISTKPTIDGTRPGAKGFARAGSNELGTDEFFNAYYQMYLSSVAKSSYGSSMNLWGGAISAVARDATAFWGRGIVYDWFINAMYYDPSTNATALAITMDNAASTLGALAGATPDVYVNWLSTSQSGIVARAYGNNLPRLRQLKATWDPHNFFINNFNIMPAVAAA